MAGVVAVLSGRHDARRFEKNAATRESPWVRRIILTDSKEMTAASEAVANTTDTDIVTLRAASIMLATIPILCVYPFLQKYFVKGVLIGSLKG